MSDGRSHADGPPVDADVVLGHLQEFARIGFWDLDLTTERLYWSTQVFEILELEAASVESYLACVHPDDLELVHQVYARARAQAGPYRLRHRTRDGARLLQLRIQSVAGPAGQPVRLMGVVSDVTSEWQLERELEDSASARLTGLLAGGVVHDLKNIFAVLLGHAQLALAADDRDQRPDRESLEALQRAATNGVELTQQLLQVGRSEIVPARRVAVDDLFRRLAATARTAIGRQHHLAVDPGPGGYDLLAEEQRLERAVVDLLLNARDALPRSGGTVGLSFRTVEVGHGAGLSLDLDLPPGTYGVIEVCDDGSGFAPEVLARATDPFFTTKGDAGSGVGLHSVARFVEAASGALHIDSTPGAGTTVRLVLPVRPHEEVARPGRRRAAPVRVLLQGADHDRIDAIVSALAAADLQCVATVTTAAAANVLRTEPIDLLVIDGGEDGDETALVRTAAATSTPVLGVADVLDDAAGTGALRATDLAALSAAVDDVLGRAARRVRA